MMRKAGIMIIVILLITLLLTLPSAQAVEFSSEQIYTILHNNGIASLVDHLQSSKKLFPSMTIDAYSKENDGPSINRKMINEILRRLQEEKDVLRNATGNSFMRRIGVLLVLSDYVGSRNAYKNLVLANMIRQVVTKAMLQRIVIAGDLDKEIKGIVAQHQSKFVEWKKLYRVLKSEMGESFDLKKSELEGKDEYDVLSLIYAYFKFGKTGITRGIEGLISLEVNSRGRHNIEEFDVPGFICLIFLGRNDIEMLRGYLEMKDIKGSLPSDKKEFYTLAENSITAIKKNKIMMLSKKPYVVKPYWKIYSIIKKSGWPIELR